MYVTPAQAVKSSSEPIPVCKKLSRAALMEKKGTYEVLEYTVEKNGLDDFILETLDFYKEYDIFPKASDTA